ncbi:universal stress protein [Deinococcus planocerae]|uniref:universal stress protein n=1 Tax=Deinococcus planocerae TaxID=1737569 RepID=UPI000C7F5DC5|nr:universal stress protein [Deinococcus planocerae]
MIKCVLVPTDFSDRAGRAAAWARETFPDAEVRLLHVVDPLTLHAPSAVAPGGGYALSGDGLDLQRDFEVEVRERLRRLGGGELVVGQPVDEILRYVQAGPFDLLVIGATGHGDPEGSGLGGTAERLTRESPVPVVVVH